MISSYSHVKIIVEVEGSWPLDFFCCLRLLKRIRGGQWNGLFAAPVDKEGKGRIEGGIGVERKAVQGSKAEKQHNAASEAKGHQYISMREREAGRMTALCSGTPVYKVNPPSSDRLITKLTACLWTTSLSI